MSITNWPKDERPRERLLHRGASVLSDAELLAIFFRTGVKGKSAVELARQLLLRFNGLRPLLESDLDAFCAIDGLGPAKYAQLQAALELGKRYLHAELQQGDAITNPSNTKSYLLSKLRSYDREVFACIFLDSQHKIIQYEELFFGTIDQSHVHVREIMKRALYFNCASIILAHNHPSGNPKPSPQDCTLTQHIKQLLQAVDIIVLDHFIIGDTKVVSLFEENLL